eukprot:COSAG02_NODE_1923_length_10327_cov_6.211501_11_plen_75_part_00
MLPRRQLQPKAAQLRRLPLQPLMLTRKVCADEVTTMRTLCSLQSKAARRQEQRQRCERKTSRSCKRSVREVASM